MGGTTPFSKRNATLICPFFLAPLGHWPWRRVFMVFLASCHHEHCQNGVYTLLAYTLLQQKGIFKNVAFLLEKSVLLPWPVVDVIKPDRFVCWSASLWALSGQSQYNPNSIVVAVEPNYANEWHGAKGSSMFRHFHRWIKEIASKQILSQWKNRDD